MTQSLPDGGSRGYNGGASSDASPLCARLPRLAALLLVVLSIPRPGWAGAETESDHTRAVAAMAARVRSHFASRANTFGIRAVRFPRGPVKQLAKLEVSFLLDATYTNPFDPHDIDVQARITFPDGKQVSVPAFYCVPFEPTTGVTQLEGGIPFKPPGAPSWRLRFSPPVPGKYSLRLVARDAAGRTARSRAYSFRAVPSSDPGFIRVAERNPAYFEDASTGKLFLGVGANVAWTRQRDPGTPRACYEYYFGRARGRMSSTRVWMCHWAWLEWTPQVAEEGTSWAGYGGLAYCNQMIAAEFDRVFRLAEENGLRVMLVTDDNNEHYLTSGPEEWFANPYNQLNGGPCRAPSDFFSSPAARRFYRNRLRYIIARWGYSPSLWAINSWNDEDEAGPQVRDWLKEMRDYVHELVRGYRPIVYGSNFDANDLMDYAQAAKGREAGAPKPVVNQECEYSGDPAWFAETLRREIWSDLARGMASVMCWPHTLVDRLDAWGVFTPPLLFFQGLDLNRGRWRPAAAQVVSARSSSSQPLRQVFTVRSAGDAPGWGRRAEQSVFEIRLDQSEQSFSGLSPYLYGNSPARATWRNPPTFRVSLPGDGQFVIDLEEIGGGDQMLEVTVDGLVLRSEGASLLRRVAAVAKHVPLAGGRRELADAERRVAISMSRGTHDISVDDAQDGGDWIRVHSYHVIVEAASAASVVEVAGLTSQDHAFLYLQNQTYPRLPRLLGQEPVPLTQVTVRVTGLKAGQYRVVLFDTSQGTQTGVDQATCQDSKLTFTVNRLADDLAVRLDRVG